MNRRGLLGALLGLPVLGAAGATALALGKITEGNLVIDGSSRPSDTSTKLAFSLITADKIAAGSICANQLVCSTVSADHLSPVDGPLRIDVSEDTYLAFLEPVRKKRRAPARRSIAA